MEPSRRPPRIVCLGQTWRSLQMKSQIVCSNNLASQPPSHIIQPLCHIPRDRVQLTAPYKILWEFNFYLIDGKLFEENRAEINKTKCNSMPNVMVPFIYNWMNSSPTRQAECGWAQQCCWWWAIVVYSDDDEQQATWTWDPNKSMNQILLCGDLSCRGGIKWKLCVKRGRRRRPAAVDHEFSVVEHPDVRFSIVGCGRIRV